MKKSEKKKPDDFADKKEPNKLSVQLRNGAIVIVIAMLLLNVYLVREAGEQRDITGKVINATCNSAGYFSDKHDAVVCCSSSGVKILKATGVAETADMESVLFSEMCRQTQKD